MFFGKLHAFWSDIARPWKLAAGDQDFRRTFNLLVFDCGGSTTDIALVEVTVDRTPTETKNDRQPAWSNNSFAIRTRVIGLAGVTYAGDNITVAILELIRAKVAQRASQVGGLNFGNSQRWSEADKAKCKSALQEIAGCLAEKRAIPNEHYVQAVPTDFGNHQAVTSEFALRHDYFFQLWNLAEQAKKDLKDKPFTDVTVTNLGFVTQSGLAAKSEFAAVTITREEVDAVVRPRLTELWEYAAEMCEDQRGVKRSVDYAVLAGNGSAYPLVADTMREVLPREGVFDCQAHRTHFDIKDAKFAVAKGAAIAEWYRGINPAGIDLPDQEVTRFEVDKDRILPYSIMCLVGGRPRKLFDRGDSFKGHPLEKTIANVNELKVFREVSKRTGLLAPLCLFDTTDVPNVAGRASEITVRVDPELQVSASLTIASAAGAVGSPAEIPLVAEADARSTGRQGRPARRDDLTASPAPGAPCTARREIFVTLARRIAPRGPSVREHYGTVRWRAGRSGGRRLR